jgi:hypothetical protein
VQSARPLYFPVSAGPLRMQAGLQRFGTDFGNGDADRQFFPRDDRTDHYLAEKARVLGCYPGRSARDVRDEAERSALTAATAWMIRALHAEGHGDFSDHSLEQLAPAICEDFAVLARPASGADRVLWLHACFPSGWRPEHVVGKSFTQIHAQIPAFDGVARSADQLAQAMVSRGPYVRFVWTISADDELDHHPEHGRRAAWTGRTERGFLRVERQLTVPLPEASASVFLIRTYLYGFDELTIEQREILTGALRQMPPELVRYKRLEQAVPYALTLLRGAPTR